METSPELRPYIEAANRSPLAERLTAVLGKPLITQGEVRPADMAPVVALDRSRRPSVFPMVWGFPGSGRKHALFNARAETASLKPAFRDSWAHRRCAIPASWYFEWERLTDPASGKRKPGTKYRIRPEGGGLAWLAGLYRLTEEAGTVVPVFTVLTREPADSIRFIHDRMPVLLPEAMTDPWIRSGSVPENLVRESVTDLAFEIDRPV